MKFNLKTGLLVISFGLASLTQHLIAQPLSSAERQYLAQQIEQSFTKQLLNCWYPLAIDWEKGGFLTSFSHDWKPVGPQDKMIVTQARHTWLPSKVAQLYPTHPHLKEAAQQGFHFLRDKMWDAKYGGFYTWVTRDGSPRNPDEMKTAYGNAFAIYALSAYYQTFGDTVALQLAKKTFLWLEKHSHDPIYGGYYQNLQRNGTPAKRDPEGRLTAAELSYKDQNSSIHLLEAFSELYSVWPDALLKKRLTEMLTLIRDTIVNEKGSLTLYLTPDWKPISYRDSTESSREAHEYYDHVSPGHDIETAYLLREASHVLGLHQDDKTVAIAKKMVDHTLKTGWDTQSGGFYERGYYFKGKNNITITDDRKNWWAQAEGLNTLLLMSEECANDPMKYGQKFKLEWQYIQKYLIDPTYGGWYEWSIEKDKKSKAALKGHAWKAAYHDGRSLMNCIQRLRPDHTAPTSPTQLALDPNKKNLQWKAAQDNQHIQGYDIYVNAERIGYTPLTTFSIADKKHAKGTVFKVVARDVQGNHSKAATVAWK